MTNLFSSYYRDSGVTQVTGWGQRAEAPLPPPVIALLSASTAADSQRVLLFSSQHHLLQDESSAELGRHTCVTPGYRDLPLISSLNCWFILFLGSVLPRSTSLKSTSESLRGTMYGGLHLNANVDVVNCFIPAIQI